MKVIYYKFHTLEDFLGALNIVEDDIMEYIAGKPGFNAEYKPSIAENDNYLIEILIYHDLEEQ